MSDAFMQVLGQIEGLCFERLEVGNSHGLVTMKLTGPDGAAYASMTRDQTDGLVSLLQEQLRELDGE
jgi:hypothetical protein